jgi:hypothetical protein
MRFFGLSATEFSLLFALSALALVVFYLFSSRRRTIVVATDPIWRRATGRRRTPFRKLLSLLLQILIVFIISLALADPRSLGPASGRPLALALVVDTSASMAAHESDGTRLERARRLARTIVDRLAPGDRLALFAMDDSCRPLTGFKDAKEVTASLGELEPAAAAEDTRKAVAFASAALAADCDPDYCEQRIVLISDHFHDLEPAVPGQGPKVLQFSIGEVSSNLELTAFDVRPRRGAARGSEVFVEVKNRGPGISQARLRIHTPQVVLDDEKIEIDPGKSFSRAYFLRPIMGERLIATLTAKGSDERADAFSLDDRAYALLPQRTARRVLLVTDGNIFLEKALSLDPSLGLEVVKPSAFKPASLTGVEAVFFDGVCPDSPVPAAYFNVPAAAPGGCPFITAGEVDFPKLLPIRGDHPLTDGITLIDMQIGRARRLVPESNDVEILRDQSGPLMIAREKDWHGGKQRFLAAGFDLAESDLPLRVAFPQLIHNCLKWFLGPAGDSLQIGPGVAAPVFFPPRTAIKDPRGKLLSAQSIGQGTNRRWFVVPSLPGFYSLRRGKSEKLLAVNFRIDSESELIGDRRPGPGRILWRPGDSAEALMAGLGIAEPRSLPFKPGLQWPALLLGVAWLLFFDWLFFCLRMLY